jgi:two-component sensor histidine kinase
MILEETQRVNIEIARYLHGNLQSRMMALSLTFSANKDESQAYLDDHLNFVNSLLDSPFGEMLSHEDGDIYEMIKEIIDKWNGLLYVNLQLSILNSDLSFAKKRAISAVIEEALSNSLRHGFATKVDLSVIKDKQNIFISVIDNGIGLRENSKGLGSQIFDSVATKGWKLQNRLDDGGTILELQI